MTFWKYVQSKGLKTLIDTTTVFTTVVACAHVKNTTVLLQGSRSSSSSRIVLYSVSFQIENDSMATPMKAAAASAGATRRARIGASGLPSGWRHHSTLGCSFVPRFTVALLKRSLLSPPPFMSTTFCACFWKHASYTLVSWCRYGCMSNSLLCRRHRRRATGVVAAVRRYSSH